MEQMVSTRPLGRSTQTSKPIAVSKDKKSSKQSKIKNRSKRKMELRSLRKIQNAMSHLNTPAAITTTNSPSPLLTLPQELKNRIYQFVLGGNLLHITRDRRRFERRVLHSTKGAIKEQRFTHQICCSPISEGEVFHQFVSEDGRRLYVKGIELRHSSCPSYRSRGPVAPLRLNVSLLRVCRQIYDEAHFIPYSTNTFSFETPRNLRAFIHYFVRRGVSVNKAFRSLRVDLIDVKFTLQAWSQAFKAVRQHMTLLDTTYVNMDQPPLWAMSDDAEQNEKDMKTLFDCLAILGKQAKSTTVVVSDEYLSGYPERLMYALSTSITQHWTVEKKRTWIAELKLTMKDLQSFC